MEYTGNRLTGREVRAALFRTKYGFFTLFGALFGGIPAVIVVVFSVITVREATLARDGAPAKAKVVARRVSSSSDSTTYRIYYEFVAEDGKTYGGDYSSDNRDYYSKEIGSQFDIRYARDDPFRVAVLGQTNGFVYAIPFLSIFLLTGGVFLFFGIRGLRRILAVYGRGVQTFGKNLGIVDDPTMRVNGRPCRLLEFEFADSAGVTRRCRSSYINDKMASLLGGMESVPIVYLPERPEQADLDLDRLNP